MGLQRFPLGGFLGGMNLVDNPYSLRSGEAQLAINVDLGLRDVLSSRKGFASSGLAGSLGSQTKSAGAGATQGSPAWVNPGNIVSSNNVRATCAGTVTEHKIGPGAFILEADSGELVASNFGFSLPAGAVPVGFKVRFERQWTSAQEAVVVDALLKLRDETGTKVGNNMAKLTWPQNNDSYGEYGGAEDLMGTAGALSKTDVENANFGVVIEGFGEGQGVGQIINFLVDHVEITVYYLVEGFGADRADHARPWYAGAKRRLMLSTNGKVKSLDAGVITTLFEGTAATTWSFEQMEYNSGGFKDSLWMMNGIDAAKKWDGTTFANWAGKPPKGNMLRVWKNMMIVSGVAAFPQRVFFSDIGNPESPEDETNGGYGNRWIDIRTSEDDLDPVTWLEIVDDVLIVFKKKSTNAIYDPSTFSFQRIANVGCEGRFQSCVVDNRVYFVNRAGVFSVTAQGSVRYESLNIEPVFKGTYPSSIDLNLLATSARMCSLPNGRVYLAVTPKGAQANRWLFEGYPRLRGVAGREDTRMPWVLDSFAGRCIKCLCSYRTKDEEVDKVVAGFTNEAGASPELVYLFESNRDGIEPITWRWLSGFKSLISEEPIERIRRLNLVMKGKLIAKLLGGSVESDFLMETEKEELESIRPESRGRYHALELRETGQVPTSVFKGEFALRGGKEH